MLLKTGKAGFFENFIYVFSNCSMFFVYCHGVINHIFSFNHSVVSGSLVLVHSFKSSHSDDKSNTVEKRIKKQPVQLKYVNAFFTMKEA